MKNFTKTATFTSAATLFAIWISYYVQVTGQDETNGCSYLDPITIDILAFVAATFLIIEGLVRIALNRDKPFKTQFTRSIRVAFGFAISTLHLMQFFHK